MELMEKYKEEYLKKNGKNTLFKKNQKIDCAKEMSQKFSLEDMIRRTIFNIPNTNRIVFDYNAYKLYAHPDNFDTIIDVNVKFILVTLNKLLINNKINDGAKLVIVSSIWEELTRENKLSYSISKAALSGRVKNIAYDLSKNNILINNILPGVIDNDMSKKTLNVNEFEYIKNYMQFNRLITLDDVYKTIKFLSIENTGITGQSIKIDLGFTSLKKYS